MTEKNQFTAPAQPATAWRVWWVSLNTARTELFEDHTKATDKARETGGCVIPLYAAQPSPVAPVETDADLPTFQDVRGILAATKEEVAAAKTLIGSHNGSSAGNAEVTEARRLLAAEDARQDKLQEILETIREQIRLEIQPENRPDGLFKNIQDAVYAMRGRTRLMDDAAVTHVLNEPRTVPRMVLQWDYSRIARQVAFLHKHVADRADGPEILTRFLDRLYDSITVVEGEEPDLTFCCGCHEEIDDEPWVVHGMKYHERCCSSTSPVSRPQSK